MFLPHYTNVRGEGTRDRVLRGKLHEEQTSGKNLSWPVIQRQGQTGHQRYVVEMLEHLI